MAPKNTAQNKKSVALYGGVIALGLVAVVGTVLFARSDAGQINVSATIASTNAERIERGEAAIPRGSQARPGTPNGGLVGKGKNTVPQPEPEVESAATSTDDDASSTEETGEDAGAEETAGESTEEKVAEGEAQ